LHCHHIRRLFWPIVALIGLLDFCTIVLTPPHHHTTPVLRIFFRDHPGEPLPEENFWTLWCKGRLTEADTQTIRLGSTPSRLTSAPPTTSPFLQAGCPSCRPTNSVKALTLVTGNSAAMALEAQPGSYILLPIFPYLLPPRRLYNRCCLFVCLLATMRKNFETDLHKIFREGWQWANEK